MDSCLDLKIEVSSRNLFRFQEFLNRQALEAGAGPAGERRWREGTEGRAGGDRLRDGQARRRREILLVVWKTTVIRHG